MLITGNILVIILAMIAVIRWLFLTVVVDLLARFNVLDCDKV